MIILALGAGCPRSIRDNAQTNSFGDLFQLERPLAASTQGCSVYLARIKGTCERVVIKCLETSAPQQIHRQVELEAGLHQKVLHPHIIRCHAFLEDFTHKYLIIEYAEQGDLRKTLHTFGEEQLRDSVAKPLLLALRHLHAQGVVHRDLKPENIFLAGSSVKLGDFGLAVSLTERDDIPGTQPQPTSPSRYTAGGTPMYTSPEVLTAVFESTSIDDTLGPKNDIWALALIVLEAVSREHPFGSASTAGYGHLLISIATHDSIAIPHCASPELRDWLALALKKSPAERASADALLQHPWMSREYGGALPGCSPRTACKPLPMPALVTFVSSGSWED